MPRKKPVFRETRPILYLLVKPRIVLIFFFFFGGGGEYHHIIDKYCNPLFFYVVAVECGLLYLIFINLFPLATFK